ncbi:MAG: glycosyltransferase family 87 protein [Jatrophihabitans sp.]|uniref:glycosyltransferase family 87 protein n=1 Tax=Jatrophihabitans sp. TaxID=1932789 RepID=UPI003F7E8D00
MTLPTQNDPSTWRASWAIGGPWGRYAAVRSWWSPLRWVLVLTLVSLLFGVAVKGSCMTGDLTATKTYSHMCASDIQPLWTDAHLDTGAVPYRDTALPYPVLTGGLVYVASELARGLHAVHDAWPTFVLFGVAAELLLALGALLVTGCTALTARRRPYDAAIVALSPLLVLHAFTAWDLAAMAAMSGALLAWARGRPVLAGALVGVGTALKLYPALLLVALAILAARTRRVAEVGWATAAAVVVWLAVNGPIGLSYGDSWRAYYGDARSSGATRDSLWAIVHTLTSGSFSDTDATAWTPTSLAVGLTVIAVLLGVAWLALRAPVRPRLAQVAFLCVLGYLLASKHWAPSESLWLLPLLALARPRWRLALLWQCSEVLVWVMTMLVELGITAASSGHGFGVSYGWLAVAVLVRDALLVALAVFVVIEMWHPEIDVVRLDGSDDPGGGVFDGAPDYWAEDAFDEPAVASAERR